MPNKYYAVKEGFDPVQKKEIRNLILESWDECKKYVTGVKGAKYKSFKTLEEAEEYLEKDAGTKKISGKYPEDCIHIYVDGSYSIESGMYSYAFIAVRGGIITDIQSGISKDDSKKQLRQIAGELEAAYRAVLYAHSIGEKTVVIFHDYAGISHHALGTWERKDESSKKYYNAMNRFINEEGMNIVFAKTEGHSGDIYNELADSFAKNILKLKPGSAVDKYLENNLITVASSELKEKIRCVIKQKNIENVRIGGQTSG